MSELKLRPPKKHALFRTLMSHLPSVLTARRLAQRGSSSRYLIAVDNVSKGVGEAGHIGSVHSRGNLNQPVLHEAVHRSRQLGIYFGPINFAFRRGGDDVGINHA